VVDTINKNDKIQTHEHERNSHLEYYNRTNGSALYTVHAHYRSSQITAGH